MHVDLSEEVRRLRLLLSSVYLDGYSYTIKLVDLNEIGFIT